MALHGELFDLKPLADLGVGVTQEGGAFVFRSPDLDSLSDASAVHQRAVDLVEAFHGLSRMATGDGEIRAVTVGGITREHGDRRDHFLVAGAGKIEVRGQPADLRAPGDPGPRPSPLLTWAALAGRDPVVLRALRLFGGQPSPVNLYRVFEVIREDAKDEDGIVQNGWTSGRQITRFRRTMNSVGALGDEARHGVEPAEPPADPMSMAEAREFITRLLRQWLDSK